MFILENAMCGFNVRNTETNNTLDFQTDWDYPRLVSMFGGNVICTECDETDGTVDCSHKTASNMIEEAGNWLFDNTGLEVNGYGTFDDYPEDAWHED